MQPEREGVGVREVPGKVPKLIHTKKSCLQIYITFYCMYKTNCSNGMLKLFQTEKKLRPTLQCFWG